VGHKTTVQPSENLAISRHEYARDTLRKLRRITKLETVFDIGAGACPMKESIESAGIIWRGFDLNPSSPQVERWDLTYPLADPDARADAVLLLDVVEHLFNPGVALRNVSSVLRPDGCLIPTTPNPRWSRNRFYAALHGNLRCFTQSDLDLNHHVFTPWYHIIEKLLADHGFEIEEYVKLDGKTPWPNRPISLSFPFRCIHALGTALIETLDPSACGMSYGIVARLRSGGGDSDLPAVP
jgi:SAM-dependent methyltransferase